jgi:tricarballylate dehydrogenase
VVAQQPGQIGYCIIDSKAVGRFSPRFSRRGSSILLELARQLGLHETLS